MRIAGGLGVIALPSEFILRLPLRELRRPRIVLSTSENLRNREIFLELTYAIREIILEAEVEARGNLPK